ncbi:PREDICTED: la-related protein 1C isoform X2 [Tarenaya hassleriana]|uniref:la-related protein 1C isoform X1 n=1 Tax=Tarenaya hassleriana TaxID=28532 RepID=UPI00053C8697|nr:PREDICTED: la-related protein 1C isoform X1 [Tarenaya hassleriana]XP_010548257.1 PREDICTED: la-related protein 1C isoform X2 [Tarenaya hassleriana]
MMASDALASANNATSSSASSPRYMGENHGSPTAAAGSQSRRPGRQVSSSPWTQIVRGESEPIAAAPSSPQSRAAIQPIASVSAAPSSPLMTAAASVEDDEKSESSGGVQGNAGKKPVWNRPSNGASEIGPVMGASSWPALSETTKTPSNKSSSDSLKSLSDGSASSSSVPFSQGTGNESVPVQKQGNDTQPNPTPHHSRHRSFKRNGTFPSANGTVAQPQVPGSFADLPLHNPSPRGHNQRNGFGSQSQGGNDNQSQRNSYRNQNGNHHQNHGGRRNQEHGNHNWNRNFNGRDGHAPPQRGNPGFVRHAPAPVQQPIPAPFMAAQTIQPFGSPVAFPELALPIYYPRMPFIAAPVPSPVFYQVQDPPLYTRIQNQIHFYFSEENLIKDTYLRQFMDDQGFVPIQLVAGFRKVAELTDNVQHILDALQGSPVVEVQGGDKIRKRHNWQKFLLPATMRFPGVSSPQSGERANTLAAQVRGLSLEQNSTEHIGSSSHHVETSKTLSDYSNVQQHLLGGNPAENCSDTAVSSPPSKLN